MADVLVTGGTGFLGSHTIARLREDGHRVRTTVRSLDRSPTFDHDVDVVEANLLSDDGWERAVDGCEYVLHVASPFPAREPENPDDVIVPARDGALRVLRAARKARRAVMTSSFAAIGYSAPPVGRPYDESDWTDPADDLPAYVRSKTIAERAAWDYAHDDGLELVVINPTGIFGPALHPSLSASVGMVAAMLQGALPTVPKSSFGIVDVRDVADAHVRAMTAPAAAGRRYLATAAAPDDPYLGAQASYLEIARILRDRYPELADRLPAAEADGPDVTPKQLRIARIRTELGWNPRPPEEAILATAESLMRLSS
ncbi:NAD-dependent epimerase/dehydratase family protein [Cryptosporangium phraense]|uniref:NAD-dependent epimerase/dehydratase family protein n=1 Tax=Cryptosporangium phraense TaxID=2593070 RepID=A0A545AL19_9ACTN|nr:NAD-dependent epimerase/dehydratase family protein [Cryptosporangium phraense]TQS42014.1 NAD-dependent epimerase/dehydratase family protein [Cryptosporangium phraense]